MRPVGTACDIGAVEYTPTGTTPKYILAYQGSPQMIVINSAAASRLVAVVFDENGNSISGETVKFTAPAQGASVIFADTGTNTSTVVTDVNGLATSSAFTANNLAGSYSVVASVSGADTPAGFSLSNSTIALNPRIQTYTANNSTTLPGTFLCDQTELDCTNGWDVHADAAHQYAFGTYAFYAVQHNRNSIDNTGMTIVSSVHVSSGYANAGWTGSQMVYGDAYGFARADDVVAHELTHGVTQYESNLFYYYQSGAINESFSDLWGEYYDQTNGMGNDSLAVQWLVGEDVTGLGVIRSFSNPPDYGDPDKISSANYYTGTSDNGGVHTNSGVNNKAVFLMVQGGSFNGKTVAALGWEKTAAIYYEVNANLLSSGADYSDLYYALQQACTNLIGQNGITSSDCVEVRNAADAVEMNGQPVPEFNTDAPYCDLGASAVALFSDDLESGTGNWIVDSRWQLDSPYGRYAHSGNHSLYADDYPDDVADVSARLAAIPIPANAYLHFVHAYDFDAYETSGYYDDGGVLEYSLDGGSTWSDAGSLIDFNGYKGTIRDSESLGNPLRGRSAFVGSSHGYISTRLNLASLAGETVIFRWRMGLDVMGYVWGWWVDDVNVYRCVTDTSAPTVTSIVRASADPTSAASVDFTVTFSEPVIDVDANDFVLNTTGNIVGATITNITGSGSTWTVVVDTGSGDGTLGLNVPVGADIQDLAANSLGGLPFTGSEQYTIDKTAPVISSMTTVGANPANAASVVFQVTFSEPVMGVDSGAFNLHIATGNITGAVIESVTANNSCVAYCDTHTVTVNTGSGSGTLELISISSAAVEDAAGNQLGSPPVYYSEYYTIDKTAPLVSSIVRASPDRTAAANVDFTVTFSEPVTGVNTTIPFSDFTPTTSGVTGAAITGVSGSDATWTVTVDTGSGDGTLGLDLTVDASITDPAGNLLEQGPFAPDEEYTIDKTHAFLVAPANGELLLYRRPTFDWSDVPDASGYRITASRSSSFSTMLWEVDAVDSTYTPSADLPGGQVIYWRVRAQLNDAWGPWSETWSFTTGNPPSVPGLSSPANASLTRDYTPLLNWNNSTVPSGAAAFDHYEVQVATDTLFTDPVLIDESTPTGQISASSYTPATDLAANTTYYWRVRSYNISGQYSNWSTVRSFRTALLPPSDLTPDDGVTVDSRKPALDWAVVEGAEGYNIQISTSSSFGSLLVNTSTTTDTFTPTSNLPAHRMIYWRVRTTGANGPSSWTTASFNTP
jgi:Zn-dependent metalloprotease